MCITGKLGPENLLSIPVFIRLNKCVHVISRRMSLKADFLNAAYFRRSLTCTLGLTNDLIDGGQPRAENDFLNVIWLRFA